MFNLKLYIMAQNNTNIFKGFNSVQNKEFTDTFIGILVTKIAIPMAIGLIISHFCINAM